ncbi:MAG: TatD family deoxyribonuclease [Alphaproteobacteria bacterium]|nr:TatD family deoxyribonuclease [Alphaproteobacteria bacterium]
MLQFIDSHIHLQECDLSLLKELQNGGLLKAVCPSTSEDDWAKVEDISSTYPELVFPAYGVHPWYVDTISTDWSAKLENKLLTNSNAWIGECGLDKCKKTDYIKQSNIFNIHISLAQKLKRPLIVHSVRAQQWLEDFWQHLRDTRFVIHSFNGDKNFVRRIIKHGGYISFSPSILRQKKCLEIITQIPLEKILVESDAPYQGKSIEILKIIKAIALIKGTSEQLISAQLINNFKVFNYDK